MDLFSPRFLESRKEGVSQKNYAARHAANSQGIYARDNYIQQLWVNISLSIFKIQE